MTMVGGELPKLTGTEVTGSTRCRSCGPGSGAPGWRGASGLPTLQLPEGQLLADHPSTVALAAVALVLIGFSQTAGDARAFAARHRYRIDINQESVAQGTANVGAGLFQGMPVSTSLSASSLNDHTGARTGLASLT
jgi:sulfate permease, SulP family